MDKSKASLFLGVRPGCVFVGWLGVVFIVTAAWGQGPSEQASTTPAHGGLECEALQEQLTTSQRALGGRSSDLHERLQTIAESLQGLENADESIPAAKLAEQKDTLIAERAALQNELKFLESARTAWQAALDACQNAARFRKELAQFQASGQTRAEDFVASDVTALQAQLDWCPRRQLSACRSRPGPPEIGDRRLRLAVI